jgi:ABC-2 type transport system permease protein
MECVQNTYTIFKRELKSYFESPVAYVFLVVFLMLTGFLTFYVTNYFDTRQADLQPFFFWHPWVYLLLVPAASMRLWAEERRAGTLELLLTMPVTLTQAIMGKFLAAWSFLLIALALTGTMVCTVYELGTPDGGAIAGGYIGSALLASTYLSVGMFTSALTRNQVISFVLALVFCMLLLMAGWPPVTAVFSQWAPDWLVTFVSACSFMPHYESLQRGVLDLRDLVYYVSIIGLMIFATHVVLENRK